MKSCLTTLLLVPFVGLVLGYLGWSTHHQRIERVLDAKLATIQDSFPGIDIKYDHLTAVVSGSATEAEIPQIKSQVDKLREGNGRVSFNIKLSRPQVPMSFSLTRENQAVTLSGTVADEATKTALGNAVKIDGVTLDNQLQITEYAAAFPDFSNTILALPLLVYSSSDAQLSIQPNRLAVAGTAETKTLLNAVSGLFDPQKWSIKVDSDLKHKVTPPPPVEEKPTIAYLAWQENTDKNQIMVKGVVPSAKAKSQVIKAAKTSSNKSIAVTDRIEVDNNAIGAEWLIHFPKFAAEALTKVENPEFQFGPTHSRINATVPDQEAKARLSEALTNLNPPGLTTKVTLAPPTRTKAPSVTVTRSDEDHISIRGSVPTQQIRESILSAAVEYSDQLKVEKQVKHTQWLDQLPGFIAEFNRADVQQPSFSLADDELILEGKVTNQTKSDEIEQIAMRSMEDQGITIVNRLTILPPKPVAIPLATLVEPIPVTVEPAPLKKPEAPKPPVIKETYQVYFATGKFDIPATEQPNLKRVVKLIKATKGQIQIDGFADPRGDPAANKFLSEQRAKQIKEFLLDQGVDPNRISEAKGHGEEPGSNYQQSRRTEIRILE